ncbi:hypothetical protein WJX84_007504, partial [Apatococcus fuscideae]
RYLLFQRRNNIVYPTNETVAQVFARLSAYRDLYDGPQVDDQGLLNTDPRNIAIVSSNPNVTQYINNFPTDVQGLSFSRTPAMIINILTLGNPQGIGGFFPVGLNGAIKTPTGYNLSASGLQPYGVSAQTVEATPAQAGTLQGPITAAGPFVVPGELDLTQGVAGPLANASYLSRGYVPAPNQQPRVGSSPMVDVGTPSGTTATPTAASG